MASRKQPPRAFYTLHEVSRMVGMGYRTLLKMAQADLIPTSRFGYSGTYLVPAVWVDNAVEGTLDHWVKIMQARGLMPPESDEAPTDEGNLG